MRRLRVLLLGTFWIIALGACSLRNGYIEPVISENANPDLVHRLTASTNCAEVGEEIVFTGEVQNPGKQPFRVTETPPFDIVIQPYDGTGPVVRWSETDQYPRDINPDLQPGETRTYSWRWVATEAYVADAIQVSGIIVRMPVTYRYPQGGGGGPSEVDVIVGVKLNPVLGGTGGMLCTSIPRR